MIRQITPFEAKAHDIQFKKKYQRPSWEHTVETYQGNGTKYDWFLVSCTVYLIGLGIIGLIVLL